MAEGESSTAVKARLDESKQTREHIRARIRQVRKRLAQIKAGTLSRHHPYISLRKADSIADLAPRHNDLAAALRDDLRELKTLLKEVKAEANELRRQQWRAQTAEQRTRAVQASKRFRAGAQKTLKAAEQRGAPTPEELQSLQQGAEKVLGMFVGVLERSPSEKNIKAVLEHLEGPMMLGSDPDCGECERAFKALRAAGEKLLDRSVRQLNSNPTEKNISRVLTDFGTAGLLGADANGTHVAAANKAIREAAEMRARQAEARFRRVPTVMNFRQMVTARSLCMQTGTRLREGHPSGLRLRRETHVIQPRESLSGISRDFYGKAGFWDVVYFRNARILGDPGKPLPTGATLHIP